mgnify:CR=1 FL=1
MKLNYADANVQVFGGEDDTTNYTIQGNAKMFQILSSGVYSDKILAVVREISCNAYDSHIQAGKEITPIEVHMPTSWEHWFSVRDYGIGMSEDTIKKIYTSYGNSTKTDSNEMTGALGIGSKSPFAYTKSFTITSIFDGIKSVYSAYIGDDYKPKLLKMTSVETTEINGVEIKVPVEASDRYKFTEAGSKIFRWFDTKPKLNVTLDIHDPLSNMKVLMDKNGDRICYTTGSGTHWAKQGTVAYPVNFANFRHLLPDRVADAMMYTSSVFSFDMGLLDITASREALSYDTTTQQNLASRYKAVYESFIDDILKNVGHETYFFDSVLNYQNNRDFYTRIGVASKYAHKKSGRLASNVNVDLTSLQKKIITTPAVPQTLTTPFVPEESHANASVSFGYYRNNKFKNVGYDSNMWSYKIDMSKIKVFIVDGNVKLSEGQIAGRIKAVVVNDYTKFYMIRVAKGQDAAAFKLDLDKLIDSPESLVIDVASLPKYVSPRSSYTKTTYAASVFTAYNGDWAKETVVEAIVPGTTTYYMDISMSGRDNFKYMNIDRFVGNMITLWKLVNPNATIRVIGLNKNQAKNLDPSWKSLVGEAPKILQDFYKAKAAGIAMREYYNKYDSYFTGSSLNNQTVNLWNMMVKYGVQNDLVCGHKIDTFVKFCTTNVLSTTDYDKFDGIATNIMMKDVVFDKSGVDDNIKLIHNMFTAIPKLPKLAGMINVILDKESAQELVQFLNLYMK